MKAADIQNRHFSGMCCIAGHQVSLPKTESCVKMESENIKSTLIYN